MSWNRLPRLASVSVACVALLGACSGDDESSPETAGGGLDELSDTGPYAAITIVGDNSRFFGVIPSLGIGNYEPSDAVETDAMFVYTHGRRVFLVPGSSSTTSVVEVYDVAEDNSFSLAGKIDARSGSSPSDIIVVDDDTGYLALMSVGVLWRFNPTTLAKTGEVDLTAYAVDDDDPETPTDNSPEPAGMAVKDGKLYVALNQSYSQSLGRDGMYMAVVDMDTDEVETVIEDTTRGYAYAGRHGGAEEVTFVDERGDLYVLAVASWGWMPGQKSGFLRIKSGEQEFDPEWEFDLMAKEFTKDGQTLSADYLLQTRYVGNGIVYASAHVPAHESNPPDWVNDKNYTIVEINLYNQDIKALSLPDTNGFSSEVLFDDGLIVAALFGDSGAGIYAYDPHSESLIGEPAVRVDGMVHMMATIQ
jgi:hypothetical protein